jgi:hypothetical protein
MFIILFHPSDKELDIILENVISASKLTHPGQRSDGSFCSTVAGALLSSARAGILAVEAVEHTLLVVLHGVLAVLQKDLCSDHFPYL